MTLSKLFTYSGTVCQMCHDHILSDLIMSYLSQNRQISIFEQRKTVNQNRKCECQHLHCDLNAKIFVKIVTNLELYDFGLKHHAKDSQSIGTILFIYRGRKNV